MVDRGDTMTTRSGRVVRFRGVSRLVLEGIGQAVRREFVARSEPIEPPMIEQTSAVGEVERTPVTEAMIERNPKLAAEFGERWRSHVAAKQRMEAEIAARQGRYMLENGVVLPPEYEKGEWRKDLEHYGIPIAENESERQAQYILGFLLETTEDEFEAGLRIHALTYGAIDEEGVERALELFRDPLRRRVRAALGRAKDRQEPLVAHEPLHGGDGGASLGDSTEPVPAPVGGGPGADDGEGDRRGDHADLRAGASGEEDRARKSPRRRQARVRQAKALDR